MTDFDPTDPASYKYWAAEHVRFADLDMLGHVNNKAYSTYYESGRIAYMRARGMSDSPEFGMALVRLEIDFRKEILYPATLRIGLRLQRVGRSSLTLACAIFNGDVCASTSIAILVRFNTRLHAGQAFSDRERAILEAEL
jgi:acyl-CoA thioester hydrolase